MTGGSMKPGAGDDPFAEDDEEELDEPPAESELENEGEAAERAIESEPEPAETRVERLADILERVQSGEETNLLTARDDSMAAVVLALDEDPDLREEFEAKLGAALGRDINLGDEVAKSDVVRPLLRAGLDSAVPDLWEDVREASAEVSRRRA